MKILIIIPFFGPTPPWIEYFIKSCYYNKNYNWLIYGNLKILSSLPSNMFLENVELSDFNTLVSKKLGIEIVIRNPYKICDLRPAFGLIFQDYLSDYDFWGYSDLDIIYGLIANFIKESDLLKYDIITSRQDYIAGHFTLYRNNKKINELYKHIAGVKRIFQQHNRHYAIDERSNLIGIPLRDKSQNLPSIYLAFSKIYRSILFRFYKAHLISFDISQVLVKEQNKGYLKILRLDAVRSDMYYTKRNVFSWNIEWKNGILYDQSSKRELMYFHFLISKNKPQFTVSPLNTLQTFNLSSNGIY